MKLWAFIKRDLIVAFSYKFQLVLQIGFTLVTLAMFYFVGRTFSHSLSPYLEKYGGDYFAYVLVGFSVSSFVTVALNSLASNIREAQVKGTLEALLCTPTSIYTILIGDSLWLFITSLIECLAILVAGLAFLGIMPPISNALLAFMVLILTFFAFMGVGMLSASFIMIFKQGNPISMLFGFSSFFLGGIFFPVDVLPQPLQYASRFLPITYAIQSLRELLLARMTVSKVLPLVLNLVIFILIVAPISLFFFNAAVKKAKKAGSLIQY